MSYFGKVILQGTQDSGTIIDIPVTPEGHLEVALHSPRLPFGSINTENLIPIFQSDAVYGLNTQQVASGSTLSGAATSTNGMFVCSTGTTVAAQAFIQSRKRARYRPGQGIVGRFTALYTTPVASSYQVVGYGHAEDGVYFGYKNTNFGILYSHHGVRETQTLTVTVGATVASNVTITLNDVAFVVAVTAASNVQRTVWEISQATYAGWKTEPNGTGVKFVADSLGNKAGAFTFAAGTTGAAASFAETQVGSDATEVFTAQSAWNGDKLDGTGASGATLDPTKGNVYQMHIQYLGFGVLVFQIEVAPSTGNNAEFITVHTIKIPNTAIQPTFGNPSFPFSMAVYSAGSTTNLTAKVGSFACFNEGHKYLHGNRFSYFNSSTAVTAASYHVLFSILNTRYYKGRTNQSVINLIDIHAAMEHNNPCVIYIIKNGTLVGNPNFAVFDTDSCTHWDTASTTVTFTTNSQLLWSGHLGGTGEFNISLNPTGLEEFTLQPGEWITVAAKSLGAGSPTALTVSLNTREDQ